MVGATVTREVDNAALSLTGQGPLGQIGARPSRAVVRESYRSAFENAATYREANLASGRARIDKNSSRWNHDFLHDSRVIGNAGVGEKRKKG